MIRIIVCLALLVQVLPAQIIPPPDAPRPAPTIAPPTVTGSVTGLVILIDFPDQVADIPQTDVDAFYNADNYIANGNNGSVHGYWQAVSQNRVNYHAVVTSLYYRAKNPYSYYDSLGHTGELLDEALDWLDGTGFDFSTLTTDGSGVIKALCFQYAGAVHSVGLKGLWGHSSWHSRDFDGVHTGPYQISELGTTMKLGGICHEIGHMLFSWPDLYDIDGSSNGCGLYCLMAFGNAGGVNPVPPNPFFRYLAGWTDMRDISNVASGSQITLAYNDLTPVVYRDPAHPGEMFIIEGRKNVNRSEALPGDGSGLIVWHVDSSVANNT